LLKKQQPLRGKVGEQADSTGIEASVCLSANLFEHFRKVLHLTFGKRERALPQVLSQLDPNVIAIGNQGSQPGLQVQQEFPQAFGVKD
jgi:hypothetical protein